MKLHGLLVVSAAIVGIGPASAGDSLGNFGGFYAGVLGGISTGVESGTYHGTVGPSPTPAPDVVYNFTLYPVGVSAGVIAGFEHPWQQFVVGIEGDASLLLGATASQVYAPDPNRIDTVTINSLGHFRVKIGMPLGNFTPFLAAGLAVANINQSHQGPVGGGVNTTWTENRTLFGASIGGGIDMPMASNMILRAEVLADGFPAQRFDWTVSPARYDDNVMLGVFSVRAGLLVGF
jgi:opacity protein-like surface antigen